MANQDQEKNQVYNPDNGNNTSSNANTGEKAREVSEKPASSEADDPSVKTPQTESTTPVSQTANTQEAPAVDDSDEDLVTVDLNASNIASAKPAAETSGKPVRRREKKVQEPPKNNPADQYKKKRIRKRIIALVILLLLIGGGLFLYFRVIKPAKATAEAMLSSMNETTDTVEQRDITNSISTTGIFEACDVRTITSTAKDPTIDAVLADVGDHVNKGDTLVIFSTEAINRTIEQLKEDLSEARRLQAVESRASDRSYLYTYADQANQLLNQSDVVEARLKALYEACDGYGDAKRALQEAKESGASEATISVLENDVSLAYQQEQTAQSNYDSAVKSQGQLVGASGNTLTKADEDHEIAAIKAGDQARQYQRQIEDYQEKLENFIITAPISGIVTLVDVEEGNGFSGGRVMVIQNTDTMKLIARVDEYDIPNVKLGQRVVIKTDATRDDELEGYISFIQPASAITKSGFPRVTDDPFATSATEAIYEATVTVQTKDPRLRIGMFGKINIIVDQVSNVLTVPYDAIQTDAQGGYYVTVVDDQGGGTAGKNAGDPSMPVLQVNGQDVNTVEDPAKDDNKKGKPGMPAKNRRDIPVEIGMEGDYYTQVISDELKPGMTVVIPDSGEFNMEQFAEMFGPGY
ncbi:MAG: efflux RND transporter periplasmic adaptor subunit [Lachnospiraceae bacterium]|nr:efflux RND transporter periplasmic adaptor subunit [Lachnospiraceae bacterium]